MTTPKTKSGAVGAVEHVRDKLLTHAEMVKGRPVNEATLRLLPSGEQCTMLAEWLGAALVELEKAPDADRTAFAAAPGWASWRERPSCGGWWWSHDAQSWNLAFHDGLGIVLVAAPNNVKGWNYAADASGWWWGPWTPPAMTPNDSSSATGAGGKGGS